MDDNENGNCELGNVSYKNSDMLNYSILIGITLIRVMNICEVQDNLKIHQNVNKSSSCKFQFLKSKTDDLNIFLNLPNLYIIS